MTYQEKPQFFDSKDEESNPGLFQQFHPIRHFELPSRLIQRNSILRVGLFEKKKTL